MSSNRSIDSRFWSDSWVRKLNALDRYVFLYFLTNDHSTWCGVYELPLDVLSHETGIKDRDLEEAILPRLSPKVIYIEEWVYVPNWTKYHLSTHGTMSPQQQKGFEDAFSKVPERIRLKIKALEEKGIPYPYPMVRVSPSTSTSTSNNDETRVSSSFRKVAPPTPKKKRWGAYDETNPGDDLPAINADTGELIEEMAPRKAEPKNSLASEAQKYFIRACDKATGTKPLKNVQGYVLLLRSITTGHLDAKLLRKRIDDWFASGQPVEKLVQITHCFSDYSINDWKAKNSL